MPTAVTLAMQDLPADTFSDPTAGVPAAGGPAEDAAPQWKSSAYHDDEAPAPANQVCGGFRVLGPQHRLVPRLQHPGHPCKVFMWRLGLRGSAGRNWWGHGQRSQTISRCHSGNRADALMVR